MLSYYKNWNQSFQHIIIIIIIMRKNEDAVVAAIVEFDEIVRYLQHR